jgi:D-amino-acid dehydrogenase
LKVFTDAGALEACVKSAEHLATGGLVFETLDAAACVRREPALQSNAALVGGVYFPREEVGDCHKFTAGLAKRCAALGVKFRYGTTISHLDRDGGRISAVQTGNGAIRADNFVAALASFTPLVLKTVGINVPIYPVKGVTITVPGDAWPGRPRLPIADDARIFGLVPLGDRLRVSGSAEVARFDTTPSPARCRAIVNNVISVFPDFQKCLDPATAKYWAGVRPVTPTGTPILDRTPIRNLFIAAGHGHLGWTMGCGSGQLVAAMVTGAATDIDMSGLVSRITEEGEWHGAFEEDGGEKSGEEGSQPQVDGPEECRQTPEAADPGLWQRAGIPDLAGDARRRLRLHLRPGRSRVRPRERGL